ncbi:MAG: glycosyltransferase [Solirubrobacterales bacterium]|nr:glycosyltransferase [Solirubrobacterales bacterium]
MNAAVRTSGGLEESEAEVRPAQGNGSTGTGHGGDEGAVGMTCNRGFIPRRSLHRSIVAAGGALAGTATAMAFATDHPVRVVLLVLAGYAVSALVMRPVERHAPQLPLMAAVAPFLGTVVAGLLVLLVQLPAFGGTLGASHGFAVATAGLAGALAVSIPLARARAKAPLQRIAVLGPTRIALALATEMNGVGDGDFELVGRVCVAGESTGEAGCLGTLEDLARVVEEHRIDLLVLAPEIPRMAVFDRVAATCLELPVRLIDLDGFCERAFGHVPLGEMNAAWFGFIMHPSFRRHHPLLKRVLDIALAGTIGLLTFPLVLVAALLVRRDGGPALFAQERIGEGGRRFRILKLRTMTESGSAAGTWTASDDSRITPIGALLRRTHIDELPQVFNVLRGEMSIVGPRPEQPHYVSELERDIPFYSRRHLIKPGITGWAQVRCGYAGSVEGSAWKMCHDLYYVKHRSMVLDLLILGETVRTAFVDRQFPEASARAAFALRAGERLTIDVTAEPLT